MRTVELKGVLYTEQACIGAHHCVGCAGDDRREGGEGICDELPKGCSVGGGTIWVRSVPKPPAYEGVATSLAKQFDQPVPKRPDPISVAELRTLWQRAYVAAIHTSSGGEFATANRAVRDYKQARAEGIV